LRCVNQRESETPLFTRDPPSRGSHQSAMRPPSHGAYNFQNSFLKSPHQGWVDAFVARRSAVISSG
jgi:hypothetical protein